MSRGTPENTTPMNTSPTNPREDFAELFYLYLRDQGQLPRCYNKPRIRAKWQFIRDLSWAIQQGRRRW
jgi:hypothetical protein